MEFTLRKIWIREKGSAVQKYFIGPQGYLDAEAESPVRHEYVAAEVLEVPEPSLEHEIICVNLLSALKVASRGAHFRPYGSNLKVSAGGAFLYPDVSVFNGSPVLFEGLAATFVNPIAILEVFSSATENFDRGTKFWRYRKIESLQIYVTVAEDYPEVMLHERHEGCWILTEFKNLADSVEIPSLGISLSLAEIYEDVAFP